MKKAENAKYSDADLKIAKIAKALSHPARIQILKFLASNGKCFCGNIVDFLPISQSTVSQHLKELKDSGLIYDQIIQPKVYYCISHENWNIAKELIEEFLKINVYQCCE